MWPVEFVCDNKTFITVLELPEVNHVIDWNNIWASPEFIVGLCIGLLASKGLGWLSNKVKPKK